MKVLELRCAHDHRFEGWFASDEDYVSQRDRDLIECPMCGDKQVDRLPTAPRLNLSKARDPAVAEVREESPGVALQSLWFRALRDVVKNTEDVGDQFAEEARRIHYGEARQRGIRGQASPEDAHALADEGIEVFALPIPAAVKGTTH